MITEKRYILINFDFEGSHGNAIMIYKMKEENTAKNMLKENINISIISKVTDLHWKK